MNYNITEFKEDQYGCIVVNGYSATETKSKKYLGGHVYAKYKHNYITCSIYADSKEKQNALLVWYRDVLLGGTETFNITLPYFGIKWKIEVRFDKDVTNSMAGENGGMVQVTLKIIRFVEVAEDLIFNMPLDEDLRFNIGDSTMIEFSRNTQRSYIKDGYLLFAGADEACFGDHGICIDNSSANLIPYSNDLTDSSWDKINGCIATIENDVISPLGVTGNVNKIEQGVDTSVYSVVAKITSDSKINDYHSLTLFIKKGNMDKCDIEFSYEKTGETIIYNKLKYNFNDNTYTLIKTIPNSEIVLHEILKNGWVRIGINLKNDSILGRSCVIRLRPSDNSEPAVAGAYFYVYGVQLEQAKIHTNYIETNGTEVSRANDKFILYNDRIAIDWHKPFTFAVTVYTLPIHKFTSDTTIPLKRNILYCNDIFEINISPIKRIEFFFASKLVLVKDIPYTETLRIKVRSDGAFCEVFFDDTFIGSFPITGDAPVTGGKVITYMGGDDGWALCSEISRIKYARTAISDEALKVF